jgi:hypothetical protein
LRRTEPARAAPAHIFDIPGAAPQLADLGPQRQLLSPQDVLLFAVSHVRCQEFGHD